MKIKNSSVDVISESLGQIYAVIESLKYAYDDLDTGVRPASLINICMAQLSMTADRMTKSIDSTHK